MASSSLGCLPGRKQEENSEKFPVDDLCRQFTVRRCFMSRTESSKRAGLRLAILALVGGFERPLALREIKEMLGSQGFDERGVHDRALAMLASGTLKLNEGLKITLAEKPWPEGRIRADLDWAVRQIGQAEKQIQAAVERRKLAIATLLSLSGRDFS
jgi:hypothetical protein